MEGATTEELVRTVWIYIDVTKEVGDSDHLMVFESPGIFERWKETNDSRGVALEHVVIEGGLVGMSRRPRRVPPDS
jgi:hypothetical protein